MACGPAETSRSMNLHIVLFLVFSQVKTMKVIRWCNNKIEGRAMQKFDDATYFIRTNSVPSVSLSVKPIPTLQLFSTGKWNTH